MYKNKTVYKLSEAIKDVIMPKLTIYLEDRQNDLSIKELIEKEIEHIEVLEDIVFDMTKNINFTKFEKNNILLDNYLFIYNKELEEFEFVSNKELTAKSKILNQEGLNSSYSITNMVRRRIDAILVTLDESSFDKILDTVENQIDFNEFVSIQKNKE